MILALLLSSFTLAVILLTEADLRYDFTTDALAEKWKSAQPLHNFVIHPAVTPLYNFPV